MSEGLRIAMSERFETYPSRFEITRLLSSRHRPADFWLWEGQAKSLYTIAKFGAAVCALGCGDGKSLLAFLAFNVLAAERGLLFTKKDLVRKTHPKIRTTKDWWQFETKRGDTRQGYANFTVVNYDRLSSYNRKTLVPTLDLEKYAPDVLVFDEAHMLANKDSARFAAIDNYKKNHPWVPIVILTGSLSTDSVYDYAHLMEWCLGHNIPVPNDFLGRQSFAAVLDSRRKMPPNPKDYETIDPVRRMFAEQEDYGKLDDGYFSTYPHEDRIPVIRKAYHRRLKSWPGVILSSEANVGVSLLMRREDIIVPEKVRLVYKHLELTEERPDGELLVDAPLVALNKLHLSVGMYHQWRWPGGRKDEEWILNRKNYYRELRLALKPRLPGADTALKIEMRLRKHLGLDKTVYIDSEDEDPEIIQARIARESEEVEFMPTSFVPSIKLLTTYEAWCKVKDRCKPPTEIVWIDKFFLKHIEYMLNSKLKNDNVIVWYHSKALEQALGEIEVTHKGKKRKLPVYKAGAKTPSEGEQCAMSLAHATGNEFQFEWNVFILAEYPRGGGIGGGGTGMEQTIARMHRPGQKKDVEGYYFEHTDAYANTLATAREDAEYQSLTISKQKLLIAEFLDETT